MGGRRPGWLCFPGGVAILAVTFCSPALASWRFLPENRLEPSRSAAPRDPQLSAALNLVDEGHDRRFRATLGWAFSLLRYESGPNAVELGVEAAAFTEIGMATVFPMRANDWAVGYPLTWRSGPLFVSARLEHLSSHLGDKQMALSHITGVPQWYRNTLGLRSGLAAEWMSLYAGTSYDYARVPTDWRATGYELGGEARSRLYWELLRGFAAVDARWPGEVAPAGHFAAQLGFSFPGARGELRVSLAGSVGHNPFGQLADEQDRTLGVCISLLPSGGAGAR